jgi:peptidoglycan-associated lipoprotein
MERHWRRMAGRALAMGGIFALAAGCAHVNEEEFAAEMNRIREEMRTADQDVEARLGSRVDEVEDSLERQISNLEAELGALRGEFEVTVERLEAAIRFNTPVHFAFDDDQVRDEDRPLLDHFAQVVSAYYDRAIITIEGFTDASGPAEYNLQLGARRAEAVREYLESAGIPADRMRTVSYGEAGNRQIDSDAQGPGNTGWQNRRVSMVIDFNEAAEGTPLAMN